MKKLLVSCVIVVVTSLVVLACQIGETATVTVAGPTTTVTTTVTEISWLDIVTYNHASEKIVASVGEEFAVALYRNPRLGLNWYETYDENLFVLLKSAYKAHATSFTGGEGDQYFIFRVLDKGSTEITFVYSHGAEAPAIEEKVFNVEIR